MDLETQVFLINHPGARPQYWRVFLAANKGCELKHVYLSLLAFDKQGKKETLSGAISGFYIKQLALNKFWELSRTYLTLLYEVSLS